MARLLLLYGTDDRDFARDLSDFLEVLDVDVEMIPRASDGGLSLQGKEDKFFDAMEAALFLITPGSERHGVKYPSPSVTDEMGRAKERFKAEPWRVIYLVDRECKIQSVDQRAYIQFVRTDHRSMIEAMRLLVAALKDAAVLPTRVPPPLAKPPEISLAEVMTRMSESQKRLCLDLSARPNGIMFHFDFVKHAGALMRNQTDGNLAVGDVMRSGLVGYTQGTPPGGAAIVYLTPLGWDLARYLRAQERAKSMLIERMRISRGTK